MNQYLGTLFFYAFSCSAVLVYGIGLEKAIFEFRQGSRFYAQFPGIITETIASTAALWFLITKLLLPYGASYLIPMAIVLVCGILHSLISLFVRAPKTPITGERIFFFGTVFLATGEASSLPEAILIAVACVLSFYILTVMLFAVRERMNASRIPADWRGTPLLLVTMGLFCLVLYTPDISWWFTEVFPR